ncbi:hypothetical protein Hypma_004954 [Hypsizygus marmoreus]|uniref:Uncharacterized protein n=1 Tax=Hypsizygus marmoreus TaxID=39966 RepID=A0A369K4Y6_HYPMA|nr:hypothetical protein Hypma_004954 [Hypsizygus marmoreus]
MEIVLTTSSVPPELHPLPFPSLPSPPPPIRTYPLSFTTAPNPVVRTCKSTRNPHSRTRTPALHTKRPLRARIRYSVFGAVAQENGMCRIYAVLAWGFGPRRGVDERPSVVYKKRWGLTGFDIFSFSFPFPFLLPFPLLLISSSSKHPPPAAHDEQRVLHGMCAPNVVMRTPTSSTKPFPEQWNPPQFRKSRTRRSRTLVSRCKYSEILPPAGSGNRFSPSETVPSTLVGGGNRRAIYAPVTRSSTRMVTSSGVGLRGRAKQGGRRYVWFLEFDLISR